MGRLSIYAFFCATLMAIILGSPNGYNNLRAYYYRAVGGALLVPDTPAPRQTPSPRKASSQKSADKPTNTFVISGLDPDIGPQISVLGGTASGSVENPSQGFARETSAAFESVESASAEASQNTTSGEQAQ